MKAPLYDAIKSYADTTPLRFHMPGHSGQTQLDPLYSSAPFDATELSFSDNLMFPKGIIALAEQMAAEAYNAPYTLFFTGGCTSALLTAIKVASQKNKDFAVLGKPHRCIINAFSLLGCTYTLYETQKEIPLCAHNIVATSPNYYGKTEDIRSFRSAYPHALIIVDEAHGAHFPFSDLLPEGSQRYADFVVNGMHKTLPVYTGGALLHAGNTQLFEEAREARAMLHTTSPSYLVMCSMDYARAYFAENGARLYNSLRQKVDCLCLPKGFSVEPTDDFTRLVIKVPAHTTGYAVQKAAEKHGIFFELCDSTRLVAILTPFNADRLDKLSMLDANPPPLKVKNLSYLLNTVAKRDIGFYPPGTVIIKKGELITQTLLDTLCADCMLVFGID